ncbi:MAG TPA: galactose-1-phosphate uridylyltransferase [Segeticoccus sp.]|uniref:galactose-1-phosphate uridylyltransferase n=1 Tax=Segeticoccus sp. TaxID=2706531 RepID=UPI002D7FF164|nr:galactose-1-phosphate uridylyltransferase [Segeticoccus sp.]HET8600909.1 galactose-1-phosphate uridylyltransferase [Segeticoccus sp.]
MSTSTRQEPAEERDLSAGQRAVVAGTLADGRQILYFDDDASAPPTTEDRARLVDERPLGHRVTAGTRRLDPLTGEWVSLAGHRQTRTFQPPRDECPLCPSGRGTVPSEIPAHAYDVVVFENRFPSFAPEAAAPEPRPRGLPSDVFEPERSATGRCEVVCFTSDHDSRFADLSPERTRTVIEAWVHRTRDLGAMPGIEHVFCFENRGREIGVTLAHPHGQIYAYPYVPPKVARMVDIAAQHHQRTGRLLGRDLLEGERADGRRVVLTGEHWTAYVPYAARWPVEVHLAPHRDVPDLPALHDDERAELAELYPALLRRLDRFHLDAAGQPIPLPYIAAWQQAPVRAGRDVFRLHLQVFSVLRAPGKLKYLAGSESGAGAWINDVTPEHIASRLREVS